jgi:hypothetical protein
MIRLNALCAGALAAVLVFGGAVVTFPAAAATDADKAAALKQATATCRAQVKEQAKFQDMSLYARHKAVKKCVQDATAGH